MLDEKALEESAKYWLISVATKVEEQKVYPDSEELELMAVTDFINLREPTMFLRGHQIDFLNSLESIWDSKDNPTFDNYLVVDCADELKKLARARLSYDEHRDDEQYMGAFEKVTLWYRAMKTELTKQGQEEGLLLIGALQNWKNSVSK